MKTLVYFCYSISGSLGADGIEELIRHGRWGFACLCTGIALLLAFLGRWCLLKVEEAARKEARQ